MDRNIEIPKLFHGSIKTLMWKVLQDNSLKTGL